MDCTPDTLITWQHVYDLAARIDAIAVTLNTPGYTTLASLADMPFKFDAVQPFVGALRVQVDPALFVTSQHLCTSLTNTEEYVLDPVLEEMGKIGELFLVNEADGCWCKTIFQVDTTTGKPVLIGDANSALGGCQSLYVPQIGDSLNADQHVIPSTKAAYYNTHGAPRNVEWETRNACRITGPGAGFHFAAASIGAELIDCTRSLGGVLVWPIRSSYMAKMIEHLKYILACSNSGGAKENTYRRPPSSGHPAPNYVEVGCEVYVCTLVLDRMERELIATDLPGCIAIGCNTLVPFDEPVYPWDTPTCGGENCSDTFGPKFYCQTLADLDEILYAAELGMRPYVAGEQECNKCDCQVVLECEYKVGTAVWCRKDWYNTGFVATYDRHDVYSLGLGGAIGCYESEVWETPDEFRRSNSDGDDTGACVDVRLTTDTHCLDDEETYPPWYPVATYATPRAHDTPDYDALYAAACDEAATAAWFPSVSGAPAYHMTALECGAATAYGTWTPEIGLSEAFAEVVQLRWRARLAGSWTCGEEAAPDILAVVSKEKTGDTPSTEIVTVTLTWDEAEGTYVSPWVTEDIPAKDGPYDRITVTTSSELRGCPSGCTGV